MRVLIAPDKFKGTLAAQEVAQALARGWGRARPGDALELLPITDGGDGFGEVVGGLLDAEEQTTPTVNAAHEPILAAWWWAAASRTAILESARAVGLAQLPPGRFHPFALDTRGLGALLRAAEARGAEHCLVGVGGSATNDGGFGVARALGWEFLDARGWRIERWTELESLAGIRPPPGAASLPALTVAVDVRNLLLGPQGCTRVFGPQKGLKPADFSPAERCLRRLADVAESRVGVTARDEPGAGAAGGLGFGLRCFAGARLEEGFRLFAKLARLRQRVKAAALVLTGEGALDASSLMGKGTGELALLCGEFGVPCVAFAGRVTGAGNLAALFREVHALTPDFASVAKAMTQTGACLERLADRAGRRWGA